MKQQKHSVSQISAKKYINEKWLLGWQFGGSQFNQGLRFVRRLLLNTDEKLLEYNGVSVVFKILYSWYHNLSWIMSSSFQFVVELYDY